MKETINDYRGRSAPYADFAEDEDYTERMLKDVATGELYLLDSEVKKLVSVFGLVLFVITEKSVNIFWKKEIIKLWDRKRSHFKKPNEKGNLK